MPEHTSTGEPDRQPTGGHPYVIEHYGFPAAAEPEAPPATARPADVRPADVRPAPANPAAPRRASPRRRGVLVVVALGLALVSGVGGVAVASADPGPDGGGRGQGDTLARVVDQNGRATGGLDAGPGARGVGGQGGGR
jgi:hypothetical protein